MASNMGKIQCVDCKGWFRRKLDGQVYKHPCVPAVSDPAPTVDETTTQGDDVAEKGPWFGAMYDGRCSVNECRIEEGDRIRADGEGGYECEDCGDDTSVAAMYSEPTEEAVTDALPNRDWQAQASAAARRHADAQAFMDPADVANAYGSMGGADPMDPAPLVELRIPVPTAEQFMDPAATDDVKPVMSVSGQPKQVRRDHMKRYAVVLPGETELERYATSGKPKGRTRATTFNKAATDKKNINDWGKRNVVIGAARRRDLLLKAQGLTHENDRDRLNAIVVELEEAAGSKVGSDLGTYLHEFTEYMDAGLKTWQDAPREFQRSLALYAQALADAGLEPIRSLIERTTIIREFGWVCGTFDRIFYHRPSGQYVIGDLKTGKTMDYGRNEVECQLWTYAHGVNQNGIYDWNTDTWAPVVFDPDRSDVIHVSESVGVVIHMPVQGPQEGTVSLLWADLEAGKAHAELCHAVRSQPKGKMRPWGDGPAPLPPRAVTSWELRFASVTSNEGASALWCEAKAAGISGVRLNELITLARVALQELGVRG